MRRFYVIPEGRDKKAKAVYRYIDRVLRMHKDDILKEANKVATDMILYGTGVMKDGKHIHFKDLFKDV